MKIKVRNNTTHPVIRGGYTIPPDGRWHLLNVPSYRFSEVISCTSLEHEYPVRSEDEEPEDMVPGGSSTTQDGSVADSASDPAADDSEPSDGPVDDDEDDEDGVVDLDTLEYSELQAMAKDYGLKANQGREQLIQAILEEQEQEG